MINEMATSPLIIILVLFIIKIILTNLKPLTANLRFKNEDLGIFPFFYFITKTAERSDFHKSKIINLQSKFPGFPDKSGFPLEFIPQLMRDGNDYFVEIFVMSM